MEVMEKLAALVPRPRVNLTVYHGVLAPHYKFRSQIVPGKSQKEDKENIEDNENDSPRLQNKRMSWARLLRRVFDIDISQCTRCNGKMRAISVILDTETITKILDHIGLPTEPPQIAPARPPPQSEWDW